MSFNKLMRFLWNVETSKNSVIFCAHQIKLAYYDGRKTTATEPWDITLQAPYAQTYIMYISLYFSVFTYAYPHAEQSYLGYGMTHVTAADNWLHMNHRVIEISMNRLWISERLIGNSWHVSCWNPPAETRSESQLKDILTTAFPIDVFSVFNQAVYHCHGKVSAPIQSVYHAYSQHTQLSSVLKFRLYCSSCIWFLALEFSYWMSLLARHYVLSSISALIVCLCG